MNLLSWILLAAVTAGFIAAVIHILKGKGRGCCGDCSACGKGCGKEAQR